MDEKTAKDSLIKYLEEYETSFFKKAESKNWKNDTIVFVTKYLSNQEVYLLTQNPEKYLKY